MIIEFAGPPGSGKSTITSRLVDHLRSDGLNAYTADQAVSVYNSRTNFRRIISPFFDKNQQISLLGKYFTLRSPLYWYKFRLNHPEFWKVVQESQQGRSINKYNQVLIKNYFKRAMIYYQFIVDHCGPDEIIIIDEGFSHRTTHFVSECEKSDQGKIEQYLKFIPKSDLLVYLQVPLEICIERVQSRGLRGRLSNLNAEELNTFIGNSIQALDYGFGFLAAQGSSLIEVDTSGKIESPIIDLEARIMELSYS